MDNFATPDTAKQIGKVIIPINVLTWNTLYENEGVCTYLICFVLFPGADGPGSCNISLPVSQEHVNYVVSLYTCFNNNTLGKLWTSSMPYLFPFIVEYR